VNLPQPPRVVRPAALPRATRPAEIPAPDHHHLPGWVRRVYGQARPILADLVGGLEGEPREELVSKIEVLTAGISAGKFSLAWHYPRIIDEGMTLFEQHRNESAEIARQRRQLETQRRKVSDLVRDGFARLTPDAIARFNRDVRSAEDVAALKTLEGEVHQAMSAARTADDRRREREIDRTRARIQKTSPRGAVAPTQESWQDVLRRFAQTQQGSDGDPE